MYNLAETLRNSAEHFMTTDYEWSHSMVHLLMDAADVVDEIEKANSDVAEKNVGKWIDKPYFVECSICHAEFDSEVTCSEIYGWPWVHCPKCGAKMEVER